MDSRLRGNDELFVGIDVEKRYFKKDNHVNPVDPVKKKEEEG